MKGQILKIFKKEKGIVSGEALSSELGISRVSIWKHIRKLQDFGYNIVATTTGYRLIGSIDALFPWEFPDRESKIHFFPKATSTMDIAGELVHQCGIDPCSGLVQQHHLRIGHHAASQFQQFFLTARKGAGIGVFQFGQFHKVQNFERLLLQAGFLRFDGLQAKPGVPDFFTDLMRRNQHHVFQNGHVGKFTRDLKGAIDLLVEYLIRAQTVYSFALENDPAAVGFVMTGDEIEQGGFSGAIGSDESGDRSLLDCKRASGHSVDPAEAFGDID